VDIRERLLIRYQRKHLQVGFVRVFKEYLILFHHCLLVQEFIRETHLTQRSLSQLPLLSAFLSNGLRHLEVAVLVIAFSGKLQIQNLL
jgi:hypothetical protein